MLQVGSGSAQPLAPQPMGAQASVLDAVLLAQIAAARSKPAAEDDDTRSLASTVDCWDNARSDPDTYLGPDPLPPHPPGRPGRAKI